MFGEEHRSTLTGMVFFAFAKKVMKKIYFVLAITAAVFTSCGNNPDSTKAKTDSSAAVTNPPDNSAATNPSLADTLYNKDSTKMKKDSAR